MRLTVSILTCLIFVTTTVPVFAKQNIYVLAKQHMDACEAGMEKIAQQNKDGRTGPPSSADTKLAVDTNDQCNEAAATLPHNAYLDADVAAFYLLMGNGTGSGNASFHEVGESDVGIAYREAVHSGDVITQEHTCKLANAFYVHDHDKSCSKALVHRLSNQVTAMLDQMRRENERIEAQDDAMNAGSLEYYEANRWWQGRQ